VGGHGTSAEFKFEKFINTQMTKKDPSFYKTFADLGIPSEFNFGADAFQMYLKRSFTQLSVRFPQAVDLVSSHSASHTFDLYEGKDDYDSLKKFFNKVAVFMHKRLFRDVGCVPHQGAKETGLSADQVRCYGTVGLGSKVEADYWSKGVFFAATVTKVKADGDGVKYDVVFDGHIVNRPVDSNWSTRMGRTRARRSQSRHCLRCREICPSSELSLAKKLDFVIKSFCAIPVSALSVTRLT
jgi:hypothetical protein